MALEESFHDFAGAIVSRKEPVTFEIGPSRSSLKTKSRARHLYWNPFHVEEGMTGFQNRHEFS